MRRLNGIARRMAALLQVERAMLPIWDELLRIQGISLLWALSVATPEKSRQDRNPAIAESELASPFLFDPETHDTIYFLHSAHESILHLFDPLLAVCLKGFHVSIGFNA